MRYIVHYFKMAKSASLGSNELFVSSKEWTRLDAKNERWALDRVNKLKNKDGTVNRAFKAERI